MRDEVFIRDDVPMTKEEIRAISLSKLELAPDSVLYDIGAGTGSVSVEAAMWLKTGSVYAIEKKLEAVNLIGQNREKFHAEQIRIIYGEAPEALVNLELPTHAFIGGTSGHMEMILNHLWERNPQIRIVINIIALESLTEVNAWLHAHGIAADMVQVQISKARAVGMYHMMMGQNPVYVISFGGSKGRELR